jgi:hypothetical protein
LIPKDCVEFSYRAVDHNNYFRFVDRRAFAKLILVIILVLYLAMPKPTDDVVDPLHALQLAKMEVVGGRQHFFAGGGQRYCALEVTTIQMFYGRVYLAHRRISDTGLDMLRIAYGSLPAAPEP